MMTFRTYMDQEQFVEFITNIVNEDATAPSIQAGGTAQKPWSATKDEVLELWKNLRPDLPIIMTPIADKPVGKKGNSSYGEDGIRVTGSWEFIASVMARLKEIVGWENPSHKLRIVFRGIDPNRLSQPNRQSFAFYVNLEKRGQGKAGRPKGT
jgi:hypothetical protein